MRRECTEEDCDRPAFGRGLCSRHYQRARYHAALPSTPPPRQCARCSALFSSRKWNAEYCSRACNEAAHHERRTDQVPRRTNRCEQCGADMAHRLKTARFCSPRCGQAWRNARTAEALRAKKAAEAKECRGCGTVVPVDRPSTSLYCSDSCKIRSRRHEAYGLTLEELQQLLAQHEVCAICGQDDWGGKGPQVDHCHATGRIRGVLCINCNNGLGRFGDDPERLDAAAAYLRRL